MADGTIQDGTIQKVNVQAENQRDNTHLLGRLAYYMNPLDGRYDDLIKGNWRLNLIRDFTAGLIVAMVAIPLAMGFAMASGLRPEQGIVGGAIAGLVGALFGGSKYQVYGPTAAFIPVIAAIMARLQTATASWSWLSFIAGVILMLMGLARLGRIVATGAPLDRRRLHHRHRHHHRPVAGRRGARPQSNARLRLPRQVPGIVSQPRQVQLLRCGPWPWPRSSITKYLLKVSPFIPAPLIALGAARLLVALRSWPDKGLTLINDKYGAIPTDFFVFTPPLSCPVDPTTLLDLAYFVAAIVFVSAVESLLCSRMADRLADNQGTPFNPNKELWGQGLVQILVPLLNGFPHTGALARTATNIKVGAITPLAGIFKCVLKLLLAAFLAQYLELVPMACIGGILLLRRRRMVKPAEVNRVLAHNRFHVGLMVYTAVMVIVTDFLTGVLVGDRGLCGRILDRKKDRGQTEKRCRRTRLFNDGRLIVVEKESSKQRAMKGGDSSSLAVLFRPSKTQARFQIRFHSRIKMGLKYIAVFLLLAFCAAPLSAQSIDAPREDLQFWNETQIIIPMQERMDLMIFGVLRVGRDLTRPVDERGGAGVAFKPNRFLTIIPTWLYVAQQPTPTRKNIEHRMIFNATFKFAAGKFAFTDRNLIERRLRNRNVDFTMYRNRLQIDHPAKLGAFDFRVFVADEVWYDSLQNAWTRNRVSAGIIKQFSSHFTAEFFYLRQNDGRARPGDAHVIGTLFRFYP